MFSFGEIVLVVVVALIVIGPEKFPYVFRRVATAIKAIKQLRNELIKELMRSI